MNLLKRCAAVSLVTWSLGMACSLMAADPAPLRALLVTGGCCHEYAKQKDVLKKGLEARLQVVISQVHSDDTSTKARFDLYDKADWAKDFDVILHDECTSDLVEKAY